MYKKYCEELLEICIEIDYEYGALMELSSRNKESSQEYLNKLTQLYNNLQKTISFCGRISLEDLSLMANYLNKLKEKYSDDYKYCVAINVVAYIHDKKSIFKRKLMQEEKEQANDEFPEENLEDEYYDGYSEDLDTLEDYPLEEKYLTDYPDELDDYYDEALSIIFLSATRKILQIIKDTKATNTYEKKYKKRLLKEYKNYFRYDFLTSNVILELLAVQAKFNPFLIDITTTEDYSPIYYNKAIEIIRQLFDKEKGNNSPEVICETLFDLTCFEEIMTYLDTDQISRLKEFTQELNDTYDTDNYGEYCISKIRKLLKK